MLKDRLRSEPFSPSLHSPPKKSGGQPQNRASNGLDQFFASLQDQQGLSILDFSGASQANISYITSHGAQDLFQRCVAHVGRSVRHRRRFHRQSIRSRTRRDSFFGRTLEFPDRSFDGALIWDTLQFLAPPLLQDTVDRLYRILRPQSSLLAFFHAEEKAQTAPLYSYRIVESKIMSLTPRNQERPVQYFNNRSLEKLFQKFNSVKFFLTRDHLREVIVRR